MGWLALARRLCIYFTLSMHVHTRTAQLASWGMYVARRHCTSDNGKNVEPLAPGRGDKQTNRKGGWEGGGVLQQAASSKQQEFLRIK